MFWIHYLMPWNLNQLVSPDFITTSTSSQYKKEHRNLCVSKHQTMKADLLTCACTVLCIIMLEPAPRKQQIVAINGCTHLNDDDQRGANKEIRHHQSGLLTQVWLGRCMLLMPDSVAAEIGIRQTALFSPAVHTPVLGSLWPLCRLTFLFLADRNWIRRGCLLL